uniref:Uncharacterized protein n=1 Tax=Chenopodium quinoa TaxID=63459 RepID=A0A803M7L6_CHEQI
MMAMSSKSPIILEKPWRWDSLLLSVSISSVLATRLLSKDVRRNVLEETKQGRSSAAASIPRIDVRSMGCCYSGHSLCSSVFFQKEEITLDL